jgi:hypothetical protein
MVDAYIKHLEFWETELKSKRISLLIFPHRPEATIARAMDIPVRSLDGSRLGVRYVWSVDEMASNPDIRTIYDGIQNVENPPLIKKPTDHHLKRRRDALRSATWSYTFKSIGRTILQQLYWTLRGYTKARRGYLGDRIAAHLHRRRAIRQVTAKGLATISSLDGKPYVLFTLHTEPERALQGLSPEYFFQLSCIASISRDLPAGFLLVVKEHAASSGVRPRDFYRQIQEFKNVVMADVREYGLELVGRSVAVVTITGSIGFEGATMGKPVIHFGRHAIYDFLPHVQVVTDESKLAGYLDDVLCGGFTPERATQAARNGARLLKAIAKVSFVIGDQFVGNPKDYGPAGVEASYQALLTSLKHGAVGKDPYAPKQLD